MGFTIDIWSHPIGSGVWQTLLSIPCEIMPPISFMLQYIASCGILLIAYIHDISKYIVHDQHNNHRYQPWSPIHKHQINGRALALSSSPWFNYNIYIMYNSILMGSKPGYYIVHRHVQQSMWCGTYMVHLDMDLDMPHIGYIWDMV